MVRNNKCPTLRHAHPTTPTLRLSHDTVHCHSEAWLRRKSLAILHLIQMGGSYLPVTMQNPTHLFASPTKNLMPWYVFFESDLLVEELV